MCVLGLCFLFDICFPPDAGVLVAFPPEGRTRVILSRRNGLRSEAPRKPDYVVRACQCRQAWFPAPRPRRHRYTGPKLGEGRAGSRNHAGGSGETPAGVRNQKAQGRRQREALSQGKSNNSLVIRLSTWLALLGFCDAPCRRDVVSQHHRGESRNGPRRLLERNKFPPLPPPSRASHGLGCVGRE